MNRANSNADRAGTVAVKVVAGHEIRRMRVAGYDDLVRKVLERMDGVARPVAFTYLDDENDFVTFTSSEEFDEAVRLSHGQGKPVKVHVKQAHLHPVSCDGCGAFPVVGTRHKCSTCPDYDLCGQCKDKGVHAHHELVVVPPLPFPFNFPLHLPCKLPSASGRCAPGPQLRGSGRGSHRGLGGARCFGVERPARGLAAGRKGRRYGNICARRYKAKLVEDVPLAEGTQVAPGARVVKTWRLANVGEASWPEGSVMVAVRGDKCLVQGEEFPVPAANKGDEVEVSVAIMAPHTPGRYSLQLRLCEPNIGQRRFGQRMCVDIEVVADKGQAGQESGPEESKAAVSEECHGQAGEGEEEQDKKGDGVQQDNTEEVEAQPQDRGECKRDNGTDSAQQQPPISEGDVQVQVQNSSEAFAFQRGHLLGMGFTDDAVNLQLLTRFQGDLLRVVDVLVSSV